MTQHERAQRARVRASARITYDVHLPLAMPGAPGYSADSMTATGDPQERSATKRASVLPASVLRVFTIAEDAIYVAVAAVLVAVAGVQLYRTVADGVTSDQPFTATITSAVNGVLFVVIVLEIYRTVVSHLEGGGFQLRPFLVIGIISAVRHILLIGAQSVSSEQGSTFDHAQIELGVNAAVALALVVALVLLYRGGVPTDSIDEA